MVLASLWGFKALRLWGFRVLEFGIDEFGSLKILQKGLESSGLNAVSFRKMFDGF